MVRRLTTRADQPSHFDWRPGICSGFPDGRRLTSAPTPAVWRSPKRVPALFPGLRHGHLDGPLGAHPDAALERLGRERPTVGVEVQPLPGLVRVGLSKGCFVEGFLQRGEGHHPPIDPSASGPVCRAVGGSGGEVERLLTEAFDELRVADVRHGDGVGLMLGGLLGGQLAEKLFAPPDVKPPDSPVELPLYVSSTSEPTWSRADGRWAVAGRSRRLAAEAVRVLGHGVRRGVGLGRLGLRVAPGDASPGAGPSTTGGCDPAWCTCTHGGQVPNPPEGGSHQERAIGQLPDQLADPEPPDSDHAAHPAARWDRPGARQAGRSSAPCPTCTTCHGGEGRRWAAGVRDQPAGRWDTRADESDHNGLKCCPTRWVSPGQTAQPGWSLGSFA